MSSLSSFSFARAKRARPCAAIKLVERDTQYPIISFYFFVVLATQMINFIPFIQGDLVLAQPPVPTSLE
jgi:hypothetical protein